MPLTPEQAELMTHRPRPPGEIDALLKGLARSQTTDLAGLPSDLLNLLGGMAGKVAGVRLGGKDIPVPQIPGGSDALTSGTPLEGAGGAYETGRLMGGLTNPVAAAKTVGGGLAKAMFLGLAAKNAPKVELQAAQTLVDHLPNKIDGRPTAGWLDGPENRNLQRQTGVHIAPGGQPTWEISDEPLRFNTGTAVVSPSKGVMFEGLAGRVFTHPELFANYPQLEKLPVKVTIDKGLAKPGGYFDPGSAREGKELVVNARNQVEAKAILTHELQHAVQNIEKWLPGGNTKTGAVRTPEEARTYEFLQKASAVMPESQLSPVLDKVFTAHDAARDLRGMEHYRAIPGENQANIAMFRRTMSPDQRRRMFPLDYSPTSPYDYQYGLARGR